jgi:hypothetical protein
MDSPPVFSPNPYANFDPSQWSNPYSSFQNKGIPFPASYMGWPTDAMGNPIGATSATPGLTPGQTSLPSTPGTTLNSAPAAAAPAAAPSTYGPGNPPPGGSMFGGDPNNPGRTYAQEQAMSPAGMYSRFMGALPGPQFNGRGGVDSAAANQTNALMGQLAANQYYGSQQPQQAAAPAAPASPSSGLTAQQYLSLLAHPNPVTTPGATVPQSAQSYQPQGGGLAQFLAGWNPAQSGPGSGFQQGFNRALRSS